MYFIAYTTQYRGGGDEFARAAMTLAAELKSRQANAEVRVAAVERKGDFVRSMRDIASSAQRIEELHFMGHSGMYGIMFGSTSWPEQFSPHEWRQLAIPFAPGARAYFHACRSARWFAPFFARTFGVTAYGHQGYTTVSLRRDRFVFEGVRPSRSAPLYLISVPGKKTHGLLGSVRKYALSPRAIPMVGTQPNPTSNIGYDEVAASYDRAFSDIRVRRDEWRWLSRRLDLARRELGRPLRVLDLGCGNGALLWALRERVACGVGVDASAPMIEYARRRAREEDALTFTVVKSPDLPFEQGSFDVVISLLSFRYLDWDPVLLEVARVLTPRGRLLVVDMVEKPLSARDAPEFVRSLLMHGARRLKQRSFERDLRALTRHAAWRRMLEQNPIRAYHEYAFYLESRFPKGRLETLNVARRARVVAFDSGPMNAAKISPSSYP
jgi:ubiquinone/menaquinone biosynthesis C-methylase UbiE